LQGPAEGEHLDHLTRIAAALDLPEEDWEAMKATVLAPSPVLSIESCFALLELIPEASLAKVKQAYRRLVKRYHPDRATSATPREVRGNIERMLLITTAYQTIRENRG
jgi:DnaJ-domain-containing protein 1